MSFYLGKFSSYFSSKYTHTHPIYIFHHANHVSTGGSCLFRWNPVRDLYNRWVIDSIYDNMYVDYDNRLSVIFLLLPFVIIIIQSLRHTPYTHLKRESLYHLFRRKELNRGKNVFYYTYFLSFLFFLIFTLVIRNK